PPMVEESREIEGVDIFAAGPEQRVEAYQQGGDGEEERDMRPVDLPDAMKDARRSHPQALGFEDASESDCRRHARAENENFRRVGKAETARNPVDPPVAWGMRYKNDEHRYAAEEVEARVAVGGGELRICPHNREPEFRRQGP